MSIVSKGKQWVQKCHIKGKRLLSHCLFFWKDLDSLEVSSQIKIKYVWGNKSTGEIDKSKVDIKILCKLAVSRLSKLQWDS